MCPVSYGACNLRTGVRLLLGNIRDRRAWTQEGCGHGKGMDTGMGVDTGGVWTQERAWIQEGVWTQEGEVAKIVQN